ncbi:MAG: hypothetical protein GX565_13175, partial [Lentisphaerae bacterium]|nr:hypothetical protein [Lentisphaerota bacterium]
MAGQPDAFAALVLKKTGLFTDLQIEHVLAADRSDGTGITGAVVRLGLAREDEFLRKIGEVLGFAYTELAQTRPTDESLTKLPARAVYQYNVLPMVVENGVLTVVTCDPFNTGMTDGLRLAAGCPVRVTLSPREEINKAVQKYYGVGADAIEKMIEDGRYAVDTDLASISKIDVNEIGAEASIVKFVNQIIAEADRQGATDIHVEPMEDELRIRYRI